MGAAGFVVAVLPSGGDHSPGAIADRIRERQTEDHDCARRTGLRYHCETQRNHAWDIEMKCVAVFFRRESRGGDFWSHEREGESLDVLVPLFGRGCFEQAETTCVSFAVHLAVDLLCQEMRAAWFSDDCRKEGNHALK